MNRFLTACRSFHDKLIEKLKKPVAVGKIIFGYGIMLSLLVGGATLLGFIVALCVGGETAAEICAFIKKYMIPAVTYTSTVSVLFGILLMYLSGEVALSAKKKARKIASSNKGTNDIPEEDQGEK